MKVEFRDRAFQLLDGLTQNNTKEWYQANKTNIEAELLAPFADALGAISALLAQRGVMLQGGLETMFRMNRDIRFSNDKSPYKTNVSGLLTVDGTKKTDSGCVYLQLDSHGGFAAFGRYGLDAKSLGPIRERILSESDQFGKILAKLNKNKLDLFRDDCLRSMPRGYTEHANHPFAEELRLTNLLVRLELPKTVWKKGDVVARVSETCVVCQELMEFVSV